MGNEPGKLTSNARKRRAEREEEPVTRVQEGEEQNAGEKEDEDEQRDTEPGDDDETEDLHKRMRRTLKKAKKLEKRLKKARVAAVADREPVQRAARSLLPTCTDEQEAEVVTYEVVRRARSSAGSARGAASSGKQKAT